MVFRGREPTILPTGKATAQLIVDFIKDNILEPESDMPLDEERLTGHLGFLTGWIIGQLV